MLKNRMKKGMVGGFSAAILMAGMLLGEQAPPKKVEPVPVKKMTILAPTHEEQLEMENLQLRSNQKQMEINLLQQAIKQRQDEVQGLEQQLVQESQKIEKTHGWDAKSIKFNLQSLTFTKEEK